MLIKSRAVELLSGSEVAAHAREVRERRARMWGVPMPKLSRPAPSEIAPFIDDDTYCRLLQMWAGEAAAQETRWRPPSGPQIRDIVANHYGVTRAEIQGKCRRATYIRPRHVAMYLCTRLGGLSMTFTGRLFGNRDHTSVLHAVKQITHRVAANAEFAAEIDQLTLACGGVR